MPITGLLRSITTGRPRTMAAGATGTAIGCAELRRRLMAIQYRPRAAVIRPRQWDDRATTRFAAWRIAQRSSERDLIRDVTGPSG